MRVVTIKRTISRKTSNRRLGWELFTKESHVEFAIEALLFGTLLAVSAWPIAQAAEAINWL